MSPVFVSVLELIVVEGVLVEARPEVDTRSAIDPMTSDGPRLLSVHQDPASAEVGASTAVEENEQSKGSSGVERCMHLVVANLAAHPAETGRNQTEEGKGRIVGVVDDDS
jgi:hypothetical protein